MNVSRPFILRPVATSLLMVAILLAGHRRLSAAAGLGAAAGRLPDDPGRHVLSGREPGRDGVVGHRAARAPVRPDAGPEADDVDQLRRQLGDHAAVRARPRASTSPSRRCRPRSTPAATFLPRDLPNPPVYSKINPADAPILTLALTSTTLPLPQGAGPRRHAPRAEDLAAARRRPGQPRRRPEARRCASRPTRRRSPPTASALEDLRTAIAAANVNQAKGSFDGPTQRLRRSTPTTSCSRATTTASLVDRLPQRRAGAPLGRRRRRSTTPRTSSRRRG